MCIKPLSQRLSRPLAAALCAVASVLAAVPATAQTEKVLNLYTARHYQTDEALYTGFTRKTGIKVNITTLPYENALGEQVRDFVAQGDIDEKEYRARLEVLRANNTFTPPAR